MDSEILIRAIESPFDAELRNLCHDLNVHCDSLPARGLTTEGSSSFEDCLLLYLLVRHFQRKRVFEVGTYVGTTAIALNAAARANGGVMSTCDPIDYGALSPWSGIRFIKTQAYDALSTLESEGHQIDFVFFDWLPDEKTINCLNRICTADAILATHDFGLGDQKGQKTVDAIDRDYRHRNAGRWFLPGASPIDFGNGIRVNYCTAFFVPNILLRTEGVASVLIDVSEEPPRLALP
jgi:predicted O-methyltransferase YrrM